VKEGDLIEIDVPARKLQVEIAPEELARRKAGWKAPAPRYTRGVMAKYANTVSSASVGAVTS
jgi:dihydroxy-acid dehydratase